MIIPIFLVIISVISMVISVSLGTGKSMRAEMREETEFLLENVVARLNDNSESIEAMESIAEYTVVSALEILKDTDEELSNENIIELAELMQVDELNYFDPSGKIIYSNIGENIGYVMEDDHSVIILQNGEDERIIEEIREDVISDSHYKYGAIKNNDKTVFQLGVDVGHIVDLSEQFEHQVIIEDLGSNEKVIYVSYIGSDFITTANNTLEYIDRDMSDT